MKKKLRQLEATENQGSTVEKKGEAKNQCPFGLLNRYSWPLSDCGLWVILPDVGLRLDGRTMCRVSPATPPARGLGPQGLPYLLMC